MSAPSTSVPAPDGEKIGFTAYASLVCAIVFFSGLCATKEWWGVFDYTVLSGGFGQVVAGVSEKGGELVSTMANFRGKGGSGAIDGFLFALSLIPSIMLSMGMITVFEHLGALRAAQKMLTVIARPLLGLPGSTALAIIASLQSTDSGAVLTRQLRDEGALTHKEILTFSAFQMTAGAGIGNFLSSGAVLFTLAAVDGTPALPVTLGTCLGIIMLGKVVSTAMMRMLLIRQQNRAA